MSEQEHNVPAKPDAQATSRNAIPAPSAPPTNDRVPRIVGLVIILIAFGFVGGWASIAPIDGAVVGPGTVTVDTYRKTIQHLEGGIIQTLHVRDGDTVEKGDLLIQLDETQARASYLVSYNRYLAERARQARLEAELAGRDDIDFPDILTRRVSEEGRISRVMLTEQREFETRREAMQGEVSVLQQRIDQLEEQIEGMQAQRASRLRTMASLEEELASRGRLAARELLPAAELRPLERQLAEAEGDAGELQASIAGARMQIGETELQILQLRRDFSREVAAALRETNTNIDGMEEEIRALEDTLDRKQIRAPADGEVVNMRFHSQWAVIRPGEPILDLVPGDEPLVVEARIRPQDVDSVTFGMPADIRFTAFSFRTTPVVEGEVTFLSADSLEDERNGEPYYLARITVSEEEMRTLGAVTLRPGMPAEVMIKTGERTPLQYLFKPISDALARSFTES